MAHPRPSQTCLFKTGTKVDLFVTSVQPGVGRFCHFWAQYDLESQLEVENLMNAVESNVQNTSGPQIVHADEFCLAKFQEDGRWYRSKVVDCHPDGSRSHAKVFFIDYGNSEIVPLSDLRTNMHEYFANHPPQTKEFVLADLLPCDGIHWSQREVDYLNDHLGYGEFSGHILATVCGRIPLLRLMSNDDRTQPLVSKFQNANIGKSYNNNHFLKSEFPRTELPLSKDLEAFVTYSLSPVKFWIQLERAEEELQNLRIRMETQYGNLSDRDLVCNFIDEGTLCAGVCSIDSSFYRAVIEECRTDGFCRTFFIDYGNSETASIQNFGFKILPDELKNIPAYAFECTLAGIPPGFTMTDTHIAIFRDLVNDIVVKARFLSVNADGVYTVALYDTNGNSIVDVMKLGSAKPLPKVVPVLKPPIQKPLQIPPAECAEGTEEEIFITMAESIDRFFGQLCKYSGKALDDFQNTLMEHYEANIASIPHISSPSVGDYCCIKYTNDEGWYRAQVEAIAGNKLDLFFIDYGDKVADVPLAEVKVLDPKFFYLPQQGILLKMSSPVDQAKFKEIIDRKIVLKLEKNLGGNCYSTTFSKKNDPAILQLLLEPPATSQRLLTVVFLCCVVPLSLSLEFY
jgi:tudor domain-containing protein 1/4/6/7